MDDTQPTYIRWNIFARELEGALKARNLRLGHLDDRHDIHGRLIHPEKVRRLQLSLEAPKNLTTLNPDELQRVIRYFELSAEEEARLRMALLATAVEMTLMDRIDPQSALLAADEVFYVLIDALQSRPDLAGIGAVRDARRTSLKSPQVAPRVAPGNDERLDVALTLIDQATLALHLAQGTTEPNEILAEATHALEKFEQALQLLQHRRDARPQRAEWGFWQREAVAGAAFARHLLAAQPPRVVESAT